MTRDSALARQCGLHRRRTDLVQPLAAGRQFRGFGWEARRDEPGLEGTLQHGEPNTVG